MYLKNILTSTFPAVVLFCLFFSVGVQQVDAAVWTERTSAGSRTWSAVTSSADALKIAATDRFGYIYTSTDSGDNWTARTDSGSRAWLPMTGSSDGSLLAAAVLGGYIYTSSDSGATWATSTDAGSRNWYSITSSADGSFLAAAVSNGYIYTSSDSGATWATSTDAGSRGWRSITSSADGTKLAALVGTGYIYTSSDSGATWATSTDAGSRDWWAITSSSDGTKLAATASLAGYIYTSTDSGATWVARTGAGARNWGPITSSADGLRLAAAASSNYIYISKNGGNSWIAQAVNAAVGSGNTLASSADGLKLAAVNSYIYTSVPGTAPTASTSPASSISTSTVLLNGSLDDTGVSTSTARGFTYGLTTAYGATTTESGSFSNGVFSTTTTALSCGTTYHFRAFAANDEDLSYGSDETFTTLICPPTVTTSAASLVGQTSAVLNADLVDTSVPTTTVRGFTYGLTTAYGATTTESGSFSNGVFSTTTTALSCGTTYHFRAYATNGGGTSYGSDTTFTTSACNVAPTVTTSAASSVGQTSVTLNADLTDTGVPTTTTRGFTYGLTTAYGATTTSSGSYSNGVFSASVSALTCNTTYHFRAYATNSTGTSYGSDDTFTTSSCTAPTVITSAASSIGQTTVTLNANLTDTGVPMTTTRGFTHGLTTTYGATTTESGSFSNGTFSASISSLTCNSGYNFRAYATNATGTSYGSNASFTTSACSSSGGGGGGGSSSSGRVSTSLAATTTTTIATVATTTPIATVRPLSYYPEPFETPAQTLLRLQTLLASLIAQFRAMGGTLLLPPTVNTVPLSISLPVRDLKAGDRGADVTALQRILIQQSKGPAAQALTQHGTTELFGTLTHNALVEYQRAVRTLLPGGYFGPVTRAQMKTAGLGGVWW